MSVADELRKAADLGYEYLELSPRADWFFWHRYPKADNAMIAEVNKAVRRPGSASLRWYRSSAGRPRTSRNGRPRSATGNGCWRSPTASKCPVIMTELSGDPNQPLKSEHAFYHSMEELIPAFERYRLQLNIEAHPYDFSERNDDAVQIIRGLNRPWINYCFCIPHAFHLSDGAGDMRAMIEYAGAKLAHVHVADCYNHRANVGNRYIVNPPGVDARVHQHNEIGNGDIDWDQTFTALRDVSFDGIAAVCVFGWEEDADAIHRRMLDRVTAELAGSPASRGD